VRRRWPAAAGVLAVAVGVGGCSSPNDMLDPQSPAAHDISTLFWWMTLAATIVFAGSLGFIVLAVLLRKREGAPVLGGGEGRARTMVLLFGFVIPAIVLIAVFTVANFAVAAKTDAPPLTAHTMRVDVVGRQWWWEIRYPGSPAITANEIHIPTRTNVVVVGTTADVIHSFWIPKLNRKIDLIPGQSNRVELRADRPGTYQGNCAEYCGMQHAHMRVEVIAQPRAAFQAWLKAQSAPARAPSGTQAARGKQVFDTNACASCHQIRGTSAKGRIGPDLTHVAGRRTLASLTIPNTRSELSAWIRNPQHIKPGVRMPGLNLSNADYSAIVAYLEGLK
jgi:cytochrome c oxidase subunit II